MSGRPSISARARETVARLVRDECGYSLVELLTVMVILGTVLGGLTTVFVQGSNAELRMNKRFEAQQHARLALDKLRREVHCASAISPVATTTSAITLTLPTQCLTGSGAFTWCTRSVGGSTSRYALFRVQGSACGTSGGAKYADYLVTPPGSCAGCLFNYTNQSSSSLGKLHVDLPVNLTPARPLETYRLVDDVVLRNTKRSS